MGPTIHCVRHAQGFHNEGDGHYYLRDPNLTPLGKQQCETLRGTSFSDQSSISLVVASPLKRALHTAYLTFQPALDSKGKCAPHILALPDAQETSGEPCDVGSDLKNAIAQNSWPVGLSLVRPGWYDKSLTSRYSPQLEALRARARDTRRLLHQKARELANKGDTNPQIALVTHGCFLHFFTEDWEGAAEARNGTDWGNCETRSYVFESVEAELGGEARVVETVESRERRGKMGPMYGREKQGELFEAAMKGWESNGLERPDKVGVGKTKL